MKRALFLYQTSHPEGDGAVRLPPIRLDHQRSALVEAGWETETVTFIRLDPPPIGRPLERLLLLKRMTEAMVSSLEAMEPADILIAHDIETLPAAARFARRAGIPLVYDSHEWWPKLISNNSRAEAIAAEAVERWYLRNVAHVLTINETIAARFRRLGKPTTVLYNSRSLTEIPPAPEGAREELGYSQDDFVMGFVGNLHELMRGGIGIRFFTEMDTLPERVKALVVGGPREVAEFFRKSRAARLLGDRVRVVDTVPYDQLALYYGALDLGLVLLARLPNYDNALGWKFFDYMARGIPMLVPDFPDMARIVRDVGCGRVYRDGRLAKTLRRIVLGPPDYKRLGWRGRRAFETAFSWDVQKKEFVNVVESLCR